MKTDLAAGPEMDRLIDEKVMGLVPCDHWRYGRMVEFCYIRQDSCPHEIRDGEVTCYPRQGITAYSSDMRAAFLVLKRFGAWTLDHFDMGYHCGVSWHESDPDWAGEASGDTPAEAICRAALKTVRE